LCFHHCHVGLAVLHQPILLLLTRLQATPETSPQCRNTFLLSPDVSELRFPFEGMMLLKQDILGLKRACCHDAEV